MDEHRLTTLGHVASARYRSSRDARSPTGWFWSGMRTARWLTILVLPMLSLGCAAMHDNHHYAGQIPTGYDAPPNSDPLAIDFAQLSGTTTSSDIIAKGDIVVINIATGISVGGGISQKVRVGDDGYAQLPSTIGSVRLAGLSLADADAAVTQAYVEGDFYRAPNVTVTMHRRKTNRILILGAVKEPGVKEIPVAESDLLSILSYAGGLADDAGLNIEIRNVLTRDQTMNESIATDGTRSGITPAGYAKSRRSPRSVKIDLVSAAQSGANDYFVGDRGVVVVEKTETKVVYVKGLVKNSGRIEFEKGQDLTLMQAISLAGGTTSQVAHKVYITRQGTHDSPPIVIQASLSRAEHDPSHNVRLAPGDVINVKNTPATVLMEAMGIIRVGISGSLTSLF